MKNRRRFLLWAYISAPGKFVRSAHPLRGRLQRRALTVAELSPESSNLWAYISAPRKVVRSAHPLRGRLRRRALTVAELSPESSKLWAYTSAPRKVVRSAHPLRGRLQRRALTVAELSPESSNLWAYNKKTTPCYKNRGLFFGAPRKIRTLSLLIRSQITIHIAFNCVLLRLIKKTAENIGF